MMQSGIEGLTSKVATVGGLSASSGLRLVATTEVPVQVAPTQVKPEPDLATLTKAVKKLNEYVAPALQSIEFTVDDETDRIIVKVIDTVTKEVLRQVPNEEVLAISKTLDNLQGLVLSEIV